MVAVDDDVRADVVGFDAGRRVVFAGPGAGKTQLLTDRLVRLLTTGARAREVLVVVFNRAAAAELRSRLARALPDQGFVELRIATIHSFSLSLVDRYWRSLGFASRPRLIDGAGRRLVIADLLAADDDPDGWGHPVGVRTSLAFLDVVCDALSAAAVPPADGPLARLAHRYLDQLRSRGLVDVSHVVTLATDLASNPAVVDRLSIAHLLVDEVQDLDPEQHRLIARLAAPARSAVFVGDPRQSIYGFRGADPNGLMRLASQLDATVVHLTESRRCRQPVLDAASALVRTQHADTPDLIGVPVGETDTSGIAAIGFPRESDEMDWIAVRLQALHAAGTPWSEMAVLCRDTPVTMPAVLAALRRARVPHWSDDVTARVPHPWVLRLDDLYALAVNDRSPAGELEAIELAGGCRLVDADPIALRAAVRDARHSDRPRQVLAAWAATEPLDPTKTRVGQLVVALNDAAKAHREGADAAEVAWRLWRSLPLARRVRAADAGVLDPAEREGLALVASWYRRVSAAVDQQPGLRADTWITRSDDPGIGDTFLAGPARASVVAVMTIHQAKGLEWDHVFVPGMVEGRFPVTVRSPLLITSRPVEALDEERRLLYVAITRARFSATLTCTVGSEQQMEAAPSRFFRDLVDHLRDPAELVGSGDSLTLADVGTRRHAEQRWAKVLRSAATRPAERVAAACGLATLGTTTPWIDAPATPNAPRPLRDAWSLSATGLQTLEKCGLRFAFDRVLRLSPFDANEHTAYGSAVHAGIADWLRAGEQPDEQALRERLLAHYEETVVPALPSVALDGPFRRRLLSAATRVARWFNEGEIGEPVLIEETFEHPHSDGVRITSRVDLVARGADGLEIIDWKTGDTDTKWLGENRQLQTYYWLLRRVHADQPVTKVRLASLRAPRPKSAIADDGYEAITNEFIDTMVDRVRNEVFDPQPGKQCDRCEFRPLCPEHQRGQESPW